MTGHVVVLFNTTRFLQKQYELFQKNIWGQFIVIDNSTDSEVQFQAFEFCRQRNIRYIPTRLTECDFSKSHGLACNLAYYHLHKEYEILGFYDHDIFPVQSIDIESLMNKKVIAGVIQERKGIKYMWPGLTIINNQFVDANAVDFMPSTINGAGVDTGGEIYRIFSQLPESAYHLFAERPFDRLTKIYLDLQEPEPCFLHLRNGSNWQNEENIEQRIDEFMSLLP